MKFFTTATIIFFVSGCASGDWPDYNYGPGDWLNTNTPLTIDTMYNYARLVEPTIQIHHVESVETYCSTSWVQGCAVLRDDHCDVYVGKVASRDTIAHEERHCRGWAHYQPRYDLFAAHSAEFRAAEIMRARGWFPKDQYESVFRVALNSNNWESRTNRKRP
jgi:hypothetical protein